MKKTLKLSAMMLTLFAALFMSSCGSNGNNASNSEVADVISLIDKAASQVAKFHLPLRSRLSTPTSQPKSPNILLPM